MNAPVLTSTYDVSEIRKEFPILAETVYGKPLVYLDNAASAQKPRAVIDAMVNCMQTGYANVHRGLHYMANAATEGVRGCPRDHAAIPQRRLHRRDHLHPQRHRGVQPRRLVHGLGRADRGG